jgi:PhzF family phenazine biosynthesis protein
MSLEALPLWLVNAFTTDTPHSGNQAGVVLFPENDPRASDDEYKQKIARDVDYAETAFLTPVGKDRWNLRWWTPTQVSTGFDTPRGESR